MANAKRAERTKRIPVAGPRNILTVTNQDPNYVYRWVNDTPGRVQRFLDGGYETVNHDTDVGDRVVDGGSKLGSPVTRNVGGSVISYLMRIPREWYNEDQEAKMAEIDALEASMRQDALENFNGSLEITRRKGR